MRNKRKRKELLETRIGYLEPQPFKGLGLRFDTRLEMIFSLYGISTTMNFMSYMVIMIGTCLLYDWITIKCVQGNVSSWLHEKMIKTVNVFIKKRRMDDHQNDSSNNIKVKRTQEKISNLRYPKNSIYFFLWAWLVNCHQSYPKFNLFAWKWHDRNLK